MKRFEEEGKVEGSIPVQARVNIRCLANLNQYWMSEGYRIKTMSQLIGHSIELLCEVLEVNGKIREKIDSIADAHNYLCERDLYQQSMKNRSIRKIGVGIAFENMREEGADPKFHATEQYNRIHRKTDYRGNPSTVQPFTGKVRNSHITQDMIDTFNNLKPEDVVPHTSQEFAMRDVELSPLKEGDDMGKRLKTIEEQDNIQADILKHLDVAGLMGSAVKEKIVK
jgi:hypothetical protein